MSLQLSDVETQVRYLIEDTLQSGNDIFTYENSNVFSLTEDNVTSVTKVYKNSVELDSGSWTYNSDTNKVTVSGLTVGDVVEIDYSYYVNYSSTEIQSFIQSALIYISSFNYYTWEVRSNYIYPEPSTREQNLIALVTAILIKPDNKTYALPNLRIIAPKDIPTADKISKVIGIFKKDTHGIIEVIQE